MTTYNGTIPISGNLDAVESGSPEPGVANLTGDLGISLDDTGSSGIETITGTIAVAYTTGGNGNFSFSVDSTTSEFSINANTFEFTDEIPVSQLGGDFNVIITGTLTPDHADASDNMSANINSVGGDFSYFGGFSGNGTLSALPTITGAVIGQTTTDQNPLSPFQSVTIGDPNAATQTEAVTVTLSAAADGSLSNLDGGSYDSATGVYTVSGTAAAVTAAVDGLVFNPTVGQDPGQSVTTTFTIGDTNTASDTAVSATASVVTSDITVVLHAAFSQYEVANDGGTLYIADTGSGGDGTQTLPGVTVMQFTDGVGLFDPTGTAEEVARLYGAALGRAPDLAGLEYWTAAIDDSNVSLAAVANAFTTSPEFISDYGSQDNSTFVQQIYTNVLHRMGDSGGIAYWTGLLNAGTSRGAVLVGFAESQENEADTQSLSGSNTLFAAGDQDNGEIYRLYEATLARAPDPAGQAFWVTDLQSGVSLSTIAQSFVGSAEFQADYGNQTDTAFVTQLYYNVLGRAPDSDGLSYWTGLLQNGVSEATVVLGFSDSAEFRADTFAATHANMVFIPGS